ncbi:MAG: hypothetical protein QM820_59805 [Minicystis sp.]
MKLNGKALVAVVMMLGSMAAIGCKKTEAPVTQEPEATPVAQDTGTGDDVATAAATAEAPAAEAHASVAVSAGVRRPAPPALREESSGRAPSAHHVWQRGYWRYDEPRTVYVWVPGYWEDTAVYAPSAPPAVIYEEVGYAPSAEYFYVPGYWRYSGREYVWMHGHWSLRRDAGYYYRPRWVNVNGRWEGRVVRWDDRRIEAWERRHPAGQRQADRGDRRNDGRDHAGHDRGEHGRGEGRDHQASRPRVDADPRGHADRPAGHQGPSHEGPSHQGAAHQGAGHDAKGAGHDARPQVAPEHRPRPAQVEADSADGGELGGAADAGGREQARAGAGGGDAGPGGGDAGPGGGDAGAARPRLKRIKHPRR